MAPQYAMNEKSLDRRVSKIADLDRNAVRELCELHPWDLGLLCTNVGMERTALSHFFSGRRPFPQKFAARFLQQIGLTIKGDIDPKHCFWFKVRAGQEDNAVKWIEKLFPQGGQRVDVSNSGQDHDRANIPDDKLVFGTALYNGVNAALILDEIHFSDHSWIPGAWKVDIGSDLADDLLATDQMPTKLDVAELMQEAKNQDYDEFMWSSIRDLASFHQIPVDDVMSLLKASIPGYKEPVLLDEDGKEHVFSNDGTRPRSIFEQRSKS